MSDPIERVLKLVAEGRLTADEAAPILDALSAGDAAVKAGAAVKAAGSAAARAGATAAGVGSGETGDFGSGFGPSSAAPDAPSRSPRFARIQVMEGGRRVVDLRVPTSLGKLALGRVPGLSGEHITELQQAISSGLVGPLLDVQDEDGDGVRIVLE